MTTLLKFLQRKSLDSKRDSIRFDVRDYQVKAAHLAIRSLAQRRNVIVDLPTGAGKTNIAFISAAQVNLSKSWESKKVLYVVPNRLLIDQVAHAASWLDPDLYRVAVSQRLAANIFDLRAALERAAMVITTPGLFASLLRSGAINSSLFVSSLSFVVVDEFDEFLTIDATRTGFKVRFEDAFAALMHELPDAPLMLMSGTAPKTAIGTVGSYTARLFAEYVDEQLRPVNLRISEDEYRRYVPIAVVHLVPVRDDFVIVCDRALKHSQQRAFSDFECENDVRLDRDWFMERLNPIARGFITSVRYVDGTFASSTAELVQLCWRLLGIVNKYTFLFEDMFEGFLFDVRKLPLVIECIEQDQWVEVPILVDMRLNPSEFWPELRAKSSALFELILNRKHERGVVFTRNVRLSDELAELAINQGITTLTLDGRLSDRQRFARLRAFKELTHGILILTRTTGKRGLDIPSADYAAVYSPKEDEYIMWQELSRIRSTLGRSKESYIFYYDGTAEAEKLKRLKTEMEHSANRYKFVSR